MSVSINKTLLKYCHAHSHLFTVTASASQQQSQVFATEAAGGALTALNFCSAQYIQVN